MTDLVRKILDVVKHVLSGQQLNALGAGVGHIHAVHCLGSLGQVHHLAVAVNDLDRLQIMRAAYLEVVGVVSRRDFHKTGPERRVDHAVGDYGDRAAACHRHDNLASDGIGMRLIAGVNGNSHVGGDRLGTCRCDHDEISAVLEVIAHIVHVPHFFGMLDFNV